MYMYIYNYAEIWEQTVINKFVIVPDLWEVQLQYYN